MKKALFQGILIAGVFGISLEALGAVAEGAGGGVADDGPTAASAVKIRDIGFLHAGSFSMHSLEGKVSFLEGMPVIIERDATIRAPELIQQGFESSFRQSQSSRIDSLSTNCLDSISLSRGSSNTSMREASWTQQLFTIGSNLELDLGIRWYMDAANTRARTIIGSMTFMESRASNLDVTTIDLTSGPILSDGFLHAEATIMARELPKYTRSSSIDVHSVD